jgi:hypothetical protein
MSRNGPLNIFYEERQSDRWLPFDRFPRRVIRNLIRGPRPARGPTRVFLNLIAGLDRIGVPYRINDFRHLRANPGELACVIGWPHVLDRIPEATPVLFGPSIFAHPIDDPGLPARRPIRQVLVPSDWVARMFSQAWPGLVTVWPVGVDTAAWTPDPATAKDIDILVYDKIFRQREQHERDVIGPLWAELRRRGLRVEALRYGKYREEELLALRRRTRAMVYLSLHETQGIAAQQMLSSGIPLLVWDKGGPWEDPSYVDRVKYGPVTTVPYWDARCGATFRDGADLPGVLDTFWRGIENGIYSPRDFIVPRFTLETCAREYVELADRYA